MKRVEFPFCTVAMQNLHRRNTRFVWLMPLFVVRKELRIWVGNRNFVLSLVGSKNQMKMI